MFIAYEVSKELLTALRPIVPCIAREDRELADQLRRAANSITLNLAEGRSSQKGNKHKHYSIAHGSAQEVRGALDAARAWGGIENADDALRILDRLIRLLWGLTRR